MYSTSNLLSNPGVIAMIVILALMLFVFVPLMIRRARRQRKRAKNYLPDLLARTGLKQDGNILSGTYRGFPTKVSFGVGYNYAEIGFEAMKGMAGGRADFHGRNMVWQKIYIEIDLGVDVNSIILKEKVGVLRTDQWIMDKIAGREVNLPEIKELKGMLKRVRIFSEDNALASKMASDNQLRELLSNWHYLDVAAVGNKVNFKLDDVMVTATYENRLTKPDHVIQALDIAARVAELSVN
ncbi:MAG: hypothetical protein C0592_11465 [Marinilabiliales bacterium]|nr:MAG: hypothetical protein C0592_11465 [Marinilabiliales bacterium]